MQAVEKSPAVQDVIREALAKRVERNFTLGHLSEESARRIQKECGLRNLEFDPPRKISQTAPELPSPKKIIIPFFGLILLASSFGVTRCSQSFTDSLSSSGL